MASFFWYVLQSHPKKEEALYQFVVSQNIEAYLPLLRAHPKNIKSRQYVPYFPGYLFIHVDKNSIEYSRYQWIPFSIGIVRFGNEPAIVSDHIINSINQYLSKVNSQDRTRKFIKGDELLIDSGIFSGYEAIFDLYTTGLQRAKVFLKLINQGKGFSIELPITQIIKKSDVIENSLSSHYK